MFLERPKNKLPRGASFEVAIPYIDAKRRKAFAKCVLKPLEQVGVKVGDPEVQLRMWEENFFVLRLKMSLTHWKETPSEKKLEQYRKKMMDLQKMIRNDKTRLNEDFEHLLSELELSTYTVRKLIQGKKEKRQKDYVYPPGVLEVAKTLQDYWNKWTKGKHQITGHGYKDDLIGKKDRNHYYDIKVNPGEYFLQMCFEDYFEKKYNTVQIRTLLSKIRNVKSLPGSMTRADYIWYPPKK